METTISTVQDIRMSRRDRDDREQRNERFNRERDDRPQTQTVNRGILFSRPRQRSPIDYDDMDRIPQGGATSSFERRNITTGMLRNNMSDIGPSEICFPLMNDRETRTKYDDRFIMPTRDTRFRQPGSSPTMPTTAHREYFSPGPGNQYGFRDIYRYPDERDVWANGRNNQHDPYDYRDRDYHRKRYPRDWDYRRGPGYRDDPHDSRYETSLSRGGESKYFMATRHNHWRQRDRRSSSPSARSSITNFSPPPSHNRSRSTKASSIRSLSPKTKSSAGNSRGSSPRRSDLERVVSSKRPLKISIQKRIDHSENEDETIQYKEPAEEPILQNCKMTRTRSSNNDENLVKLRTSGTANNEFEERLFNGNDLDGVEENIEGYGNSEKGGWTGWRSIDPGLVAINEQKEREQKRLSKDEAVESGLVTDQIADMDLSSGENDEQPSQPQLEDKLSVCSDELESMEESDAVDDSTEYRVEISKKGNETIDTSINRNQISINIYNGESQETLTSRGDEKINGEMDIQLDNLSSKVGDKVNHDNFSLPVIPEVTNSPRYIIEGSTQLEDDKIDYNAIGEEIEKVENEIDRYQSLLDQKRRYIEEKNLARANRKSKSNKRVNFEFHQEAILIQVEQMESTLTNEQANINNVLTANHKLNNVQNVDTLLSVSPENDKVTNDHEGDHASNTYQDSPTETCKRNTMWEIIYSENKERTNKCVVFPFDSFNRFGSWGQTNEIYKSLPEYPFYKQNILDHNRLRLLLVKKFQDQKASIKLKEQTLQQEWKTLYYSWKQKFEMLQKTKGKTKQDDNDNNSTSGFAARWPVRTNRGRRRGDVVRSEAEMEEVMKILQDEQRKCQTWANIPPMILDPKERQQAKFINNNRSVSDPEDFYDYNVDLNVDWTNQEREDFYELFKSFPKKFGKVAEHLKDKSANDCVIYYYRNKKELKLKELIPKNGRGQRTIALNSKAKKNNNTLNNNNQNIGLIDSSSTSVIINNIKVLENVNEGFTSINEIPEETNEISNKPIERPPIIITETVSPSIEQSEVHKDDVNEENSEERSDVSMQPQHRNANALSNVQEKSTTQEKPVNNPESNHACSIQGVVEESTLSVTKKPRVSKGRRRSKVSAVKDSDQQEGEPVKKKRNIVYVPPSTGHDKNSNLSVVISDAQETRKLSSVNDDGVEETARNFNLMSLDGNDTHSSTQPEITSVTKSKGRPKQTENLMDNEVLSHKSSTVNDDRISQKKISSYWNKREVGQFEQSLKDFGKQFKQIADVIKSKTEVQVKNYYEKHYEKQNIGINLEEVRSRPTTSDDIQSSQEKQQQAKSNVLVNHSVSNDRNNAHNASINSQNNETTFPRADFLSSMENSVNITQIATERQISQSFSLSDNPSNSSGIKRSTPQGPQKSNISLLLNNEENTSNVDVASWFDEQSSKDNESEVSNDPMVNDRRHSITGETNMQHVVMQQVPNHLMTQNSELHRPNNIPTSLSQQPSSQQYARSYHMQQMFQKQQENMQKQQMEQQRQFYAHLMSNPQNQQHASQRFSQLYVYMPQQQQQSGQQVHQPLHQAHQQSHHHQQPRQSQQIQQQRITNSVVPIHNITSNNATQKFVPINIQQNYNINVPHVYRPPAFGVLSSPVNMTGSSTTSPITQHNTNVSQQSSFTTLQPHQTPNYNTNEMITQIHRVNSPFNGTSHSNHLFTQSPVRQHPHFLLQRNLVGRPTSSMSSTPVMGELNYNGQHQHLLHTRPSIVMPSSSPGIVQGMQGSLVSHGHTHNFTSSPRPFSGERPSQQSSERSKSRHSSPLLNPKIEPPS
ncbi:3573_t:CDS:2 [Funneliformis caledonium]|uniref:3573_t:CDS:1 n=1 Tax=Funneliformis caledonium TaxID=1117310 RepID=A0A9N8V9E2_9GLOM|nr:3573_t:CDS:2 [Funneliformis caledonium]